MDKLNITSIFYSIQGEGSQVGTPTVFIRLSGCNLKCKFCDTNFGKKAELTPEEILERIKTLNKDVKDICLTGGEPLMQDIDNLLHLLHKEGYILSIETNGTYPAPENCFISVSPKSLKCDYGTIKGADQIKFLCGFKGWETFIETFIMEYKLYTKYSDRYFLQPIWDSKMTDDFTIQEALKYIYKNPWMRLSVQLHKYIGEE